MQDFHKINERMNDLGIFSKSSGDQNAREDKFFTEWRTRKGQGRINITEVAHDGRFILIILSGE